MRKGRNKNSQNVTSIVHSCMLPLQKVYRAYHLWLNIGDINQLREIWRKMTRKISRCNICGEFFDSKTELKRHKDKKHRIAASKMKAGITKLAALSSPNKKSKPWSDNNEDE
jgi:hypothetical protein